MLEHSTVKKEAMASASAVLETKMIGFEFWARLSGRGRRKCLANNVQQLLARIGQHLPAIYSHSAGIRASTSCLMQLCVKTTNQFDV